MDDKLDYKQTAKLLGVSVGTLYALVFQKRIPHIRFGNRFVRFSRSEIEAWMAAFRVEAQKT